MKINSLAVKSFGLGAIARTFRTSWTGHRSSAFIRKFMLKPPAILLATLSLLTPQLAMAHLSGKVVDAYTRRPIEGATVTLGNEVEQTDEDGTFRMKGDGDKIMGRAYGYLRAEQSTTAAQEIKLVPFSPKALYLSFYGVRNRALRESAIRLIHETELNALVIDVKGDRGMIAHKSSIPLSSEVGAQKNNRKRHGCPDKIPEGKRHIHHRPNRRIQR